MANRHLTLSPPNRHSATMQNRTVSGVQRRRAPSRLAVAVGVVLVVLVGANVTGLAPIQGGPMGELRDRTADQSFEEVASAADRVRYTTALAENNWPVPITILSVTAVGAEEDPAVTLVGAKAYASVGDGVILGFQEDLPAVWQSFDPIAGITVQPRGSAQHAGVAILIRFDPVRDRDVLLRDVVIDYAVGPFRFRSSAGSAIGLAILVCPAQAGATDHPEFCPPDPG
jgi:hypothetical protein